MKYLIEVEEDKVTEYFETIDYIKEGLLKIKDEIREEHQEFLTNQYQSLLEQYQDKLNNIIIERG